MSYPTLVRTLDQLRNEAPPEYKAYRPITKDPEKLNQARAAAYIHLFLKVRFGLHEFADRHSHVCDGRQDGGVDGYFVDTEERTVTLIQSKFRANAENFRDKALEVSELLKMEVARISKGESVDSNGHAFSSRIKAFQRKISGIRDIALYKWRVVLLANLKRVNDEQLRRLLDNMDYEVFDYRKSYNELVFPLTTGTSFKPGEITIKLNLGRKQHPLLSQDVDTAFGGCNVRMLFVPTLEIAKCTAKYQNALLSYNPRNYLSLSRNDVNKSIRDTVKDTSKNEFALLNNGITMLAEYSSVTDRTGVTGEGQLVVKSPQILNGGQTATTLATMFADPAVGSSVFSGKEVLLKIIERPKNRTDEELSEFIESISDATNKQSKIVEADRRSNNPRLVRLQKHFYEHFGLFLERKRGEFLYGLQSRVLVRSEVLDRVELFRALTAFEGDPQRARSSQERIFEEEGFERLLAKVDDNRVALAHFALAFLSSKARISPTISRESIRYGKYAMLHAVALAVTRHGQRVDVRERAERLAAVVLKKWPRFESRVKVKRANTKYKATSGFNWDGYYKGATVAHDVRAFRW